MNSPPASSPNFPTRQGPGHRAQALATAPISPFAIRRTPESRCRTTERLGPVGTVLVGRSSIAPGGRHRVGNRPRSLGEHPSRAWFGGFCPGHRGLVPAATNDRPTAQRPTANQATNHTTTPTDPQPTIDLAPLADVIRDQNRRLEELSASAAFWQVRALRAEEQLQALTAGETPPETVPERPGSPQTDEPGPRGVLDRLLRWWRG